MRSQAALVDRVLRRPRRRYTPELFFPIEHLFGRYVCACEWREFGEQVFLPEERFLLANLGLSLPQADAPGFRLAKALVSCGVNQDRGPVRAAA